MTVPNFRNLDAVVRRLGGIIAAPMLRRNGSDVYGEDRCIRPPHG
jgi:hypothetical protein